jgi:hypothetical protein
MGIKITEIMHPRRAQIILRSRLTKGTRSEPSRGHEWTLVPSRELVAIRANTTVRRQVEGRIIVVVAIALLARPALVCLVAGMFGGGPGPNIDLNDAIEEFARCALDCSLNSLTVALPRVPGAESSLFLGGAYSGSDFHSQLLRRVRHGDGHRPCLVRCAIPFLQSRICETIKKITQTSE